ncbi:hypothetical protein [Okeania sp. SIO2B9]|nr:hypothetical protein [Okeania sp. SIO2B9]NES92275.1 hypothetical protein [Okeania sp. SIO2B9]
MIRLKPWQRPLAFFAYLVNDSRKALSYFIKNYNLLKTDIVAACEMTLLLSILVSPFYLWKVQLYQELKVRQQSHQISAVADMKGDVQSEGKSLSLPNLSS